MASEVLSESRADVFKSITAKIIASIEAGAGTFTMPWHGSIIPPTFPVNAATDAPYRGVNILSLWADAMFKRYIGGYWASYRQWQTLGAQVRKGERGSMIIFYKKLEPEEDAGDKTDDGQPRFVARASYVFNAEQVDGWQPPAPKPWSDVTVNEQVAAFVRATGADVRHGVHAARYRRDLDLYRDAQSRALHRHGHEFRHGGVSRRALSRDNSLEWRRTPPQSGVRQTLRGQGIRV